MLDVASPSSHCSNLSFPFSQSNVLPSSSLICCWVGHSSSNCHVMSGVEGVRGEEEEVTAGIREARSASCRTTGRLSGARNAFLEGKEQSSKNSDSVNTAG